MKYRDAITIFLAIFFFLSLAYTAGVDKSYWIMPLILFIVLIVFVYTLWIEK